MTAGAPATPEPPYPPAEPPATRLVLRPLNAVGMWLLLLGAWAASTAVGLALASERDYLRFCVNFAALVCFVALAADPLRARPRPRHDMTLALLVLDGAALLPLVTRLARLFGVPWPLAARIGVTAACAALAVSAYALFVRFRARQGGAWRGGWLGAARRWAGIHYAGPVPDGADQGIRPVEAVRLWVYLAVAAYVTAVPAAVLSRAPTVDVVRTLNGTIAVWFVVVLNRYGRPRIRRQGTAIFGGYLASAFVGATLLTFVPMSMPSVFWWGAGLGVAAFAVATYVLVTNLPERRRTPSPKGRTSA